jgi:two-component system sensor kinase FixL
MMKSDPADSTASQELQALLDAAVDGIIIIDHRGLIQAFNHAAEHLLGYRAKEVLGSSIGMLMSEHDRARHHQYLARYLETGVPHIVGKSREVQARRKDGSLFPVTLSVGAVQGSEPRRFVGFIQDASPRYRAEADIHRLQLRLTHVSRLATIGEMSGGIAHELNQPLTAVANYAQACDRLLGLPHPDIDEIRGALKEITAQAVRAGDIIHRLRALSRHDLLDRELTDINALISELAELIQLDARTHQVRCRLELAVNLPRISADRAQIQQVILILVRNAIEAFADTAVAAREITVRTLPAPQGGVEVTVYDNGPGVPGSIVPRLFDPFCSSKPNGTGLGLAISRTIVKAHQGSLDYRPNAPTGACFIVRLPTATQG